MNEILSHIRGPDEPPEDERGDRTHLEHDLFASLVDGIRDHNIAEFLRFFINGPLKEKFFTSPAARGENPGHHAFKGGLAYHTLHAANLAGKICDHYNRLGIKVNRDIVVAGVILHDIGKVDCYRWEKSRTVNGVVHKSGYAHTSVGKMIHHIPHGYNMFMTRAYDFCWRHQNDPDRFKHTLTEKKIQHLGHIILSHHGRRSWSSPVVPNTIEAYIVHLVEMGDAMVDKYNKGIDVREIYDH
jgi:3'-5' exoribonuclease